MKKKKIVVVADRSGRLVGCALPSEEPAQRTFEQETTLAALPGQTVYDAQIPHELIEYIGRPSFAEEIFRYRVGPKGRLVRAKEGKKRSQPRAHR